MATLLVVMLIFQIIICASHGGVPTNGYDFIEPDNEDTIRKRNPEMSDEEIEYCLQEEANYFMVDIDSLRK